MLSSSYKQGATANDTMWTTLALEDFFTLTEMRDGLSSIARVEDMVSVIQNAKGYPKSNKNDTIRQWLAVASTLTATKYEECLNRFVQLNGLSFLNKWLQEANDPSIDTSGTNVEEIVIALFASLEKLSVDKEIIVASGIEDVIKKYLDHESLQIKEKARVLCDKWKWGVENVSDCADLKDELCEQSKSNENGVRSGKLFRTDSGSKESNGESRAREPTSSECEQQTVTACSEGIHKKSISNQVLTPSNSGTSSLEAGNPPILSPVSDSSVSTANKVGFPEDRALQSAKGKKSDKPIQDTPDTVEETDVEMPDDDANGSQRERGCDYITSIMPSEILHVDNIETARSCESLALKNTCSSLSRSVNPDFKSQVDNGDLLRSEMNNVSKLGTGKGLEDGLATTSDVGAKTRKKNVSVRSDSQLRGHNSLSDFEGSKDYVISHTVSLDIAKNDVTKPGHKSELELAFADDALEVAQLVAIEVDHEVAVYKEPLCSSPGSNSGEIAACSSEEGKGDQPAIQELIGAILCEKEQQDDFSSSKGSSEITVTFCSVLEIHEQDVQSTMLNKPLKEPAAKSENDKYIFDLNADICNEEPECLKLMPHEPAFVSAPMALVASARGAPSLCVTSPHFEEGGWKGSAATSAFQPATSRRTLDSERAVSSTKQKTNLIEIDLNVVDDCDDVLESISVNQFPASSSLPSENSSVEVSSRKAEKIDLDLNLTGDKDASTYPSEQFKQQNGQRLPSVSSSLRHHSLRDFNLNDNPTFLDNDSSQNLSTSSSKVTGTSVSGSKLDDPMSLTMGSRMDAVRKDSHMQFFSPNQPSIEHVAFTKPLMPYAHSAPTPYSCNGWPAGPTMSAPLAFYPPSSIPFLVDPRTQTAIPNVFSAGGSNAAASVSPPFLMSLPTGPSHPNLYGTFHPRFDLNSGGTLLDVGTKEGGNLRQLFLQGQNNLVQDRIKASPQPSSSGSTMKRKEPETGWKPYPCGYRRLTHWQ